VNLAQRFDESQHPRVPAGSPDGGQFADDGGGASTDKPAATDTPVAVATDKPTAPAAGKKKVNIEEFEKDKVNLTHKITHDRKITEKFIEEWNEHIQEAPAEFKKEFLGGLNATMNIDYSDYNDAWTISGTLMDDEIDSPNANKLGTYKREISWEKNEADSTYFKLDDEETGGGIGKTLLAANVAMYKKLGLEGVTVHANIDVGGYAWARYGYVPTKSSWRELSGDIEERISKLAGGSGSYTAGSWDELSSNQQEHIFDAWRDATHGEYMESEIENWRDSGSALLQAKDRLAERFNFSRANVNTEWARDALDDYREKRETVLGKGPIPFTNDQLLKAITVDFQDRRGDGGDDPEITFNDDKLKKPEGYDPAQQTLPGIEPTKPEDLLTSEMRDGIEKRLIRAFNRKAESDAEDIDPPDYLSDNIADYQSESWDSMRDRDKFSWAEDHGYVEEAETSGGHAEIDESTADDLRHLASSSEPKAVWAIADTAYGKDLLLNSDWYGKIDFSDKETMQRFNAYVSRAKEKKA
jgi:GNAT superfamily N-acetyltransferase